MVLRAVILVLALACFGWAALYGPPIAGARLISELGKQVAAGESFAPDMLQAMLDTPSSHLPGTDCHMAELRGRMLIATRLAELALNAGETHLFLRRFGAARNLASRLLACQPYDPLAWFALYWSSGHLEGFGGRVFDRLAMSYRTGPLEGWISFRRNPQAASVIAELPAVIRQQVVDEWRHLAVAWHFMPAAASLQRAMPRDRELFLAERVRIPDTAWLGFARYLERNGSPLILHDVVEPRRR